MRHSLAREKRLVFCVALTKSLRTVALAPTITEIWKEQLTVNARTCILRFASLADRQLCSQDQRNPTRPIKNQVSHCSANLLRISIDRCDLLRLLTVRVESLA